MHSAQLDPYLPGDLEHQIGAFVDYYNNERYHESLNNVTPADVYFGRDKGIIRQRCAFRGYPVTASDFIRSGIPIISGQ